jgi:hypothetical protein
MVFATVMSEDEYAPTPIDCLADYSQRAYPQACGAFTFAAARSMVRLSRHGTLTCQRMLGQDRGASGASNTPLVNTKQP